jgi:hypothetical protein
VPAQSQPPATATPATAEAPKKKKQKARAHPIARAVDRSHFPKIDTGFDSLMDREDSDGEALVHDRTELYNELVGNATMGFDVESSANMLRRVVRDRRSSYKSISRNIDKVSTKIADKKLRNKVKPLLTFQVY